VSLWPRNL